jgi:ligand-binding sensor domain-containing protein
LKIFTKHNLLLFIIILFTSSFIVGQEYIFKHFSTKDGLPSSQVFHVLQDSKGYIWFATDYGVSRYNGYEFTNFDINDGLVGASISEIYEDETGKIWFIGIGGNLAYYLNNEIHPYKYNNNLSNVLPENPVYLKSNFYVSKNEEVFISFKTLDLIKIDKLGEITEYQEHRTIEKHPGNLQFGQ